jgi:hypothetical protein
MKELTMNYEYDLEAQEGNITLTGAFYLFDFQVHFK